MTISCLVALAGLPKASPVVAAPGSSVCDLYVDNAASGSGNGSLSQPWTTITGHLNLAPGQTLCLRGNVSGAGRVYPVERLELTSSGTATAPLGLRAYPGEKVILRSMGGGAVLRLFGDHWIIEDLIVDNNASAWRAMILDTGSAHNTIRRNEFFNGLNNGIDLREGSVDNVIEDNHIHHFIRTNELDSHCIQINPTADRNLIQRNLIHDCTGDGIQMTPPNPETDVSQFADGVRIADNVFYRGSLPRSENAIDIKAAKNLTVAGNTMSGYFETSTVLVQKASRNLLFEGNVIYASLRGFNLHDEGGGWPEGITLQNNILYDLADYGIQIMGVRDGTFVHNTIVDTDGRAVYVAGTGLFTGAIRNNLVVSSGPSIIEDGAAFQNVAVGPNGWFSAATDWPAAGDVARSGSPGFEDAAAHDFRLRADSFALDKGVDLGVSFDFEGDDRPSNVHPDLGADEYALGLRLFAAAEDQALRLWWTPFDHDQLASYNLTYRVHPGGSAQSTVTIPSLSTSTLFYRISGLTNYVLYQVQVVALDAAGAELGASNALVMRPTDRFVFLPLTTRLP